MKPSTNSQFSVYFPLLKTSVQMPAHSTVADACAAAGYAPNLVCGGKGKCKKCQVKIQENGLTKKVLSCQKQITQEIQILINPEDQKNKAKILTASALDHLMLDPCLESVYLPPGSLRTAMAGSDWQTVAALVHRPLMLHDLDTLRKLSGLFHCPDGITCIFNKTQLLDILPGRKKKIYALAFDIGTTTVVGYLYNMADVELVGIESRLNRQTQVGGDVINRIEYTIHHSNGLDRLHTLIIDTVNEIIGCLCRDHGVDKLDIYQAVFCGNSAMQHLFLKIAPEYLGKLPFSSTTHREVSTCAEPLNLSMNPRGSVSFLPLLGGFVGADTSAVLISLPDDGKKRLVIDLGTNGEIAVGSGTRYLVASTACGPALEGAGIQCGMRGTTGAIERFAITGGKVSYQVIGGGRPRGICGSAIIDIVSELLDKGVISERGRFCETVSHPDLFKRIVPWDRGRAFVICHKDETESGEPIVIRQKDIRQVQLAKGAIKTGCMMLIEKYGTCLEQIDEILIAGAFGNYIDIRNAQDIGMIPFHPDVPAKSMGNAAGTGCQMYLLCQEKQALCRKISDKAEHVELASDPEFSANYIRNTMFRPEHAES